LAEFTYKWDPKVKKVVSGAAPTLADWVFSATEGMFLDGGHEVFLVLRRPKAMTGLTLVVEEAWAHYDLPYRTDIAYTKGPLSIPINTPMTV